VLFSGSGGDGVPPTTTYVVRAPDNTPWDDSDNVPVQTLQASGCTPTQYRGYDKDLAGPLSQANPSYDPALAATFRQWVRTCTIDAPVAGDYLVQVRTDAPYGAFDLANTMDPNAAGGGHNRFSMRAGWVDTATGLFAGGSGVSVFADATMALYANAPKATFSLAHVLPGSEGQILSLSFFDISDCSACSPVLTITPPADSGLSTFSGCTVVQGPPSATAQSPLGGCALHSDGSFNGRWVIVNVPIPSGYTCDTSSSTGCWVGIRYDYSSGTVQDTTTWSASILGDPVRLVE
jgi:hypothetical protein